MKKIEAFIRPGCVGAVITALDEMGAAGISLTESKGYGKQKGHTEHYRGSEYTINLLPKVKLEIVVPDGLARAVVETVRAAAHTGGIGDGKIFISEVLDAVRIRTGERGEGAL